MGIVIVAGAILIALTAALKSLLLIAMFTIYPRRKQLSRGDLAAIKAISTFIAGCLIFRDLKPTIGSLANTQLGIFFIQTVLILGFSGGIGLTLVVASPLVSRITSATAKSSNPDRDLHAIDGQQMLNKRVGKAVSPRWFTLLSVLLGLSAFLLPTFFGFGGDDSEPDSTSIHSTTMDIAFSSKKHKEILAR